MAWWKQMMRRAEVVKTQLERDRDPRRQMDVAVEHLESDAADVQTALANHLATVSEFKQRAETARRLAERRAEQASAALLSGDQELARKALGEEQTLETQAEEAETLWNRAEETARSLRSRLQEIELEVLKLKEQRDQLVARADTAQLEQTIADIASGIDQRSRSFEQMAEQVERLEVEAQAHREVAGLESDTRTEHASDVDGRLDELRRQLGLLT